jgi:hypothetical protein
MNTEKLLCDLYKEVMFAIGQKFYYIERNINELREHEVSKRHKLFNIDIKGMDSDLSEVHTSMLSVPHTNPVLLDLYAKPINEYYELYAEYLRSLPLFENNLYLSEAGAGKIIDAILAAIKAIYDKIVKAIQNKRFELARNWVIKNENTLLNMTFPDNIDIDVLPYKTDIKLPEGFNKLTDGLKAFNKDSLKDPEAFKRSLYPSDTVYKWFTDNPSTAPQRYMNLILFNDGTEEPVKLKKITKGADLTTAMKEWVANVKGADKTAQDFKTINDGITSAMNNIKSITSQIENTSTVANNNNNNNKGVEGTTPPSTSSMKKESVLTEAETTVTANGSPPNVSQDKNIDQNNQQSSIQAVDTAIQEALTRLWIPIGEHIIGSIFKQYGYIKTAYSNGNTSNT